MALATLIPTQGTAVITVLSNVTGARVGGILLQAGTMPSPTLLQWGSSSDTVTGEGEEEVDQPLADDDYSFIQDVYARVGGPLRVRVDIIGHARIRHVGNYQSCMV